MKKLNWKRLRLAAVMTLASVALAATTASACTTIYAGGNLTQDKAPMIARSEDYGSDMNKLWFISEAGAYQGIFRGCPAYGPFVYELSHPSYRFTYFKNDNVYDGVCPECGEENAQHASYTEFGTNEKGVSVSATETIYGNSDVLALDPYRGARWAETNSKPAGIEETDIPTVLLSEADTARGALELLLDIYDTYGCAGGAGLFICDKNESWYVENCTGTQYVAIRLNDDLLFLEPNMAVIGRVDLDDTQNVIASDGLIELAEQAGTFVGEKAENIIDFRASYARISGVDKRLVEGLNYLNAAYQYDNEMLTADNTRFTISNLDGEKNIVPLYTNIQADRTLSTDDIFNYYKLSTIAKSGNQEIEIFQIFKDRQEPYATVGWVAVGDLARNVFVPYYPMLLDGMYAGYQEGTPTVQFVTQKPDGGLFYPYKGYVYNSEAGKYERADGYRVLPEGWEKSYYWCFEILNDVIRYFEDAEGKPLVTPAQEAYVRARLAELQQSFYEEFVSPQTLMAEANPRALATKNGAAMAEKAQALARSLVYELLRGGQNGLPDMLGSMLGAGALHALGQSTPAFADVPAGSYYASAAQWAQARGIVSGTAQARFSPALACTRAQAVTMLYRAAGCPETVAENPFEDVDANDYFYKAVLWAVANGITSGTDETRFSPDAPCTRGQIVTFLHRAARCTDAHDNFGFTDVKTGAYCEDAVNWAVALGLTNGTGETTFSPEAVCTRAQIVTFLYRNR